MVSTSKVEGCCSHLDQLEKGFKILRPIHDPVVKLLSQSSSCGLSGASYWRVGVRVSSASSEASWTLSCWRVGARVRHVICRKLAPTMQLFDVVLGENPALSMDRKT